MIRTTEQLRRDALAIWWAGVDAVRGDRLVRENVRVEGSSLWIGDELFDLEKIRRIAVVGAGKAGASMAEGLQQALGEPLMAGKQLAGWLNVPADCTKTLSRIHLHAARPAGLNEPTAEGVAGTEHILRMVRALEADDLCLCLISGGGSALLPAPVEGISLADKRAITQHLSAAGANIQQLNTVRKQLSRIKGGGLARACGAGRLISLIISDVIGDPLDIIASGPTVADPTTPQDALDVWEQFDARRAGIAPAALAYLQRAASDTSSAKPQPVCQVTNLVIGNIAVAVDAAGIEAERRGYSHAMSSATKLEGPAEQVGWHLAEMALRMRDQPGPDCLITGGEPIVRLVDAEHRGLGGRSQQLVLAALEHLLGEETSVGGDSRRRPCDGLLLLSGGTDGEDGPTDAAGAWIDASIESEMHRQGLDPSTLLRRNDAYHFFEPLGALIKTGPTHTNVCDLRVVVVQRVQSRVETPNLLR